MAEAYEIIEALLDTSDDPELYLLAADLAFGASGMTEVLTTAIMDLETVTQGTTEDLEAVLEILDVDLIAEGAAHIQAAVDAGAEVTDTQYIIAGVALFTSAVEKAGGIDQVDDGYEEFQEAETFLEAGGAAGLLDMFEI
jgi:hypothetical protein